MASSSLLTAAVELVTVEGRFSVSRLVVTLPKLLRFALPASPGTHTTLSRSRCSCCARSAA